jgi:2-oxoglutarate ferredoxin oxidoreductase subunit beta
VLYDMVRAAFHHPGFSFVRIIQRCPEWLPDQWEPFIKDPKRILRLDQNGHDASDIDRAREVASRSDPIPVGILYRNADVPRYEDLRRSPKLRTPQLVRAGLEAEFDKFTVWPEHAR